MNMYHVNATGYDLTVGYNDILTFTQTEEHVHIRVNGHKVVMMPKDAPWGINIQKDRYIPYWPFLHPTGASL